MTGNIFCSLTGSLRAKPVREILNNQQVLVDFSTQDDFYKVSRVSFDNDLIEKGITSSMPIILGLIPFTKLTETNNAESDILNIQRNLDSIALSNVNDVINQVTGSASSPEILAIKDETKINLFKSTVQKLTSAYNAKAEYMTYLSDPLGNETQSDFLYSLGRDARPNGVSPVSRADYPDVKSWCENGLRIETENISKYTITALMQIVRNACAIARYGTEITTGEQSNPLSVNKIKIGSAVQYNMSQFDQKIKDHFKTIKSNVAAVDLKPEEINSLIAADSRDVGYTRAGIDAFAIFNTLFGDLSSFDKKINLSRESNIGIFTGLMSYQESRDTVLTLDVNLSDQANLEKYRAADEYFIGLPLVQDKNLLINRASQFASSAREIESALKDNFNDFIPNPLVSIYSWAMFIPQMRSFAQDLGTKADFTNITATMVLYIYGSVLAAADDNNTRHKLIRILSLRDRYKNPQDYVASDLIDQFRSQAYEDYDNAINDYFSPLLAGAVNDDVVDNEKILENINSFMGKTGLDSQMTDVIDISNDLNPQELFEQIVSYFKTSAASFIDYFYTAAANAGTSTNFTKNSEWSAGQSVLSVNCDISTGFLKLSRDERAFLFLEYFLQVMKDFPFKISIIKNPPPPPPPDDGVTFEEFIVGAAEVVTAVVTLGASLNESEYTSGYGSSRNYSIATFSYSKDMYRDLGESLLTLLPQGASGRPVTYWNKYVLPIIVKILQGTQTFYEGVEYVYKYITQASSLLTNATNLAFNYTPSFDENLSNNYTLNSISNLNRQKRFALAQNSTYNNFSKDQYKLTDTLNGFLKYVQDDPSVSTVEDSFIIICALPYGILDRLGAFNRRNLGYINLTLTIRTIDNNPDNDVKITKKFPLSGIIEHQLLEYSTNTNVSSQKILEATNIYELNENQNFVVNSQFDLESKKNELLSVSLLNYIQQFYGIDFNPYVSVQKVLPDATDQNIINLRNKCTRQIYSYRFDELVETRYVSTAENCLTLGKSNIMTQALGGNVFDKVVAIPVDAQLLKNENGSYLVDVLVNIETIFERRIATTTPRSITTPKQAFESPQLTQSINDAQSAASRINLPFGSRS